MSKVLKDLDVAGLLSERSRRVFSPGNPSAVQNLSAPPVQHGQLWYDKDDRDKPYIGTDYGLMPMTNLALNPSFETASGTVEVRKNHCINPLPGPSTTGWSRGGTVTSTLTSETTGGPPQSGGAWIKNTLTAAGTDNIIGMSQVTNPLLTTVSAWVMSSKSGSFRFSAWTYDAAGTYLTGTNDMNSATFTLVANTWTFVNLPMTQPATAYARYQLLFRGSTVTWAAADYYGIALMTASDINSPIAQYPSFTGGLLPAVRLNHAANPNFELDMTGWGISGSLTSSARSTEWAHRGAASCKVIASAAGSSTSGDLRATQGSATTFPPGIQPGETYTVSAYIYTPVAMTGLSTAAASRQRRILAFISTNGTGFVETFGAQAPNGAGVYRITNTFTVPANATGMILGIGCAGSGTDPSYVTYVDSILIEKAATADTYFDGGVAQAAGYAAAWYGTANASPSYVYDTDLTAAWTGTAHNSSATLSAPGVASVPVSSSLLTVSSKRSPITGSRSLRQITKVPTSDVFTVVAGTVAGGGGSNGVVTLEVGKTYTVLATARQEGVALGTPNSNGSRQIVVIGSAPWATTKTTQGPNATGVTEHRVTFTVPSTAYGQVRLYHGHPDVLNQVDLWWDNLMIVEGEYTGPYVDGDMGGLVWNGTAHASPSYYSGPAWVPLSSEGDPIVDPTDSGVLIFDPAIGAVPPTPAYVPTGAVSQFAGATAPSGWLICDGSLLLRSAYPELFAAIGTAYNIGGEAGTQFRLPDLKGRVPVGRDVGQTEFDVVGEAGGAKTHLLTAAEMPSHTHIQNSHTHSLTSGIVTPSPITGGVATPVQTGGTYGFNYITAPATAAFGAATATNQNTGGDGAHNNLQPYLVLNYIIKT